MKYRIIMTITISHPIKKIGIERNAYIDKKNLKIDIHCNRKYNKHTNNI